MNEYLFLFHSLVVLAFLLGARFLGKEALVAFVSSMWFFANLFVTKQISLFGFEVTASDVYAIGGMVGMSIIQEFWGKKEATRSVWISFFLLLFTAVSSYLHLQYLPSVHDSMQPHFQALLQSTPRLVLASIVTFFITARLDIVTFGLLQRIQTLPFPVRSAISTALVMLIDTILFSFLGLYGIVSSLADVCIISYAVKLLVLCILTPFLSFTRSYDPISI